MARKRKQKVEEVAAEVKPEMSGEETVAERDTNKLVAKQLDGKFNKKGAKSLYELMGEKHSPYDHQSEEEYERYLDSLNLTDLELHATEMGVAPKEMRQDTIANLLRQFRLISSDYYHTRQQQPVQVKVSKAIINILSEGR
jgi:hypothetical protein